MKFLLTLLLVCHVEIKGRIRQERENHDLVLDNKKLEAKEFRDTVLESIKLSTTIAGAGFQEFLSDRDRLFNVVVTVSSITLGIYASKTAAGVAGRFIEARLGKPSLVRETSRTSFLRSPLSVAASLMKPVAAEGALKNIVLEPSLEERLRRVAVSTSNAKKNRAPFRNVLLAGPPGGRFDYFFE